MEVVFKNGLDSDQSKLILTYLRDIGVESFTVNYLTGDSDSEAMADKFYDSLKPFTLGKTKLEQVSWLRNSGKFQEVECYSFQPETVEIISGSYGESLTDWDVCKLPEDWIFYRDGQLKCGVVSHECFDWLRLDEAEYPGFKEIGIDHEIEKPTEQEG